jgi:hypothetical protein
MVDVVQAFEVKAPLAHLVRTKLLEQPWVSILYAADQVHDEVSLAWGEADERCRPFTPAAMNASALSSLGSVLCDAIAEAGSYRAV